MANIEKGKTYRCTKECWLPVIDKSMDEIGRKQFICGSISKAVDDSVLLDSIGNRCHCLGAYELFFEEVKQEDEKVEHPNHYNQNGIECFDVIKAAIGDEGFESFCYGNVLKYLFRARYKCNYNEDLKKASFYLNQIIKK